MRFVATLAAGSACCLSVVGAAADPGQAGRARNGWTPIFVDHFAGPAGSRADSKWTYDRGTGYRGAGCPASWGTGEVETETAAARNVRLDGRGHLLIQARRSAGSWISGRIETVSSRFAAPAGGQIRVAATIRQPRPAHGLGYWPAFWILGAGFRARGAGTSGTMACSRWPAIGEIDVLEDVNALSEHSGTLHCGVAPGGPCHEFAGRSSGLQPCHSCQTRYHIYSVIVDRIHRRRESITWYLDGKAYFTVAESQVGASIWKKAVDHGFFLILDLAIGGSFPNAACACTTPAPPTSPGAAMSVAAIAVYTRNP